MLVEPRIPVGKYKIVLLVDGQKYDQFINIKPNNEKGFTAKSIDQLYKQAMRLYQLQEKLAALVDTLDKSMAVLSKISVKTPAQEFTFNALDSMRREMLELNRQTVFFDEFKYRRRLSDVYVEVATALEPLSATKEGTIDLLAKELFDFNSRFYSILNKKQ